MCSVSSFTTCQILVEPFSSFVRRLTLTAPFPLPVSSPLSNSGCPFTLTQPRTNKPRIERDSLALYGERSFAVNGSVLATPTAGGFGHARGIPGGALWIGACKQGASGSLDEAFHERGRRDVLQQVRYCFCQSVTNPPRPSIFLRGTVSLPPPPLPFFVFSSVCVVAFALGVIFCDRSHV